MGEPIRTLAIVGGGTAGWLAASLINAARNRRNDGPDLRIVLIESPNVPIIGVGEATTLSMVNALAMLGVDEADYFQKCDASIKAAVKFIGWDRNPDGSPQSFYHPFEAPDALYAFSPAYHYLRRARQGRQQPPIAHAMAVGPPLLDANRAPRAYDGTPFEGLAPYAYHLDAVLFANFLRDYATTLGVEYVSDDVLGATLDARGFIETLTLKERGAFPVDFVIDCSGFQGLIIRKTLNEPFIPYDRWLLCDKALAVQLPHAAGAPLTPYTTSTALGAGWSWQVPLYSRRGTGYVFSSRFATDDQAIDEFLGYLGEAGKGASPRVIKMNIGRSRRSWVNNCLAIGLAGGFIEPLESTSIHFIQMAIRWFIDSFPDKDGNPALIDNYNHLVQELYEEIRDFITLHYRLSNRTDTPFWQAAREGLELPDGVKAKLERWRTKLPSPTDVTNRLSLFSEWAYIYVLAAKGFWDGAALPIQDAVSDADYEAFARSMQQRQADALARAPDHRDLITRLRAQPATPWYRPEPAAAAVP